MKNIQVRHYTITEACETAGIGQDFVVHCIRARWIQPATLSDAVISLDDEDLARIHLIHELIHDFGANYEAIPIILHLLDQIYYLKKRAEQRAA